MVTECNARGYHQTLNFVDEGPEVCRSLVIHQRSQFSLLWEGIQGPVDFFPFFFFFTGKISLLSRLEITGMASCHDGHRGATPAVLSPVERARTQDRQ